MRTIRLTAVAILAAALFAAQAIPALGSSSATTAVSVTTTEFALKLSKKTVKKGTVVFTVTNAGQMPHDFKIAGKKTASIEPGATRKLTVKFAKAGRYAYACTVMGHGAAGMKGTLTVR